MNDKYADLQIDDIDVQASTTGTGYLTVKWSGSLGFGEFTIGKVNDGDHIRWAMDSESMSKEFCMALLEKLYEKCEGGK